MMDAERCIICGDVIPEGRQVCPCCENAILQGGKTQKIKPTVDQTSSALLQETIKMLDMVIEKIIQAAQSIAEAVEIAAGWITYMCGEMTAALNKHNITVEALKIAEQEHPRITHLAEHAKKKRVRKKNKARLIKYAQAILRRGTSREM